VNLCPTHARRALALGLLLGAALAHADAPSDTAAAQSPEVTASAPHHRLTAYALAGAIAYLSSAQTMGGLGAGLGVRDTLDDRFLLQVDAQYLGYIGNTVALRAGAGVQLHGVWAPAALVTLSVLVGDRLAFYTPDHPSPLRTPNASLGILLEPVRFTLPEVEVSLLQLGLGVGTDLPGLGLAYTLGLLAVGIRF